ncbi:MAG: 4Fe-4S binding protein, partial [Oscillospiraceae bacterium]|nr:4Fe-4S binding protein [Oscillospiraceae bacterium]
MCVKNCPNGAITVTDFHAVIDYEKCTGCGTCTKVCPTKAVRCI